MDDLDHIRDVLTDALPRNDLGRVEYCAQFVASIARTAQDEELLNGASAFFKGMEQGNGGVRGGETILQVVQKKLDEMNEDPTASKGEGGPVQTLIIEMDAWNLRERDQWGLSQALREKGEEPKRWHWVWVGTIFNLEQRLEKNQRPVISNRGYVATLEGKEKFQKELHSEALRRGLAQAQKVIVLGDGAAWIWNLADDRFKEADQRLDLYHVYEHLESLGRALFKDVNEAKRWIKRKKKQFK